MLDDSLSAGRLDPPKGPASPTVTLNESHDDLVEALQRHGKGRLAVGDRFASYQIRGVLGHGPMGFVYEAWDAANERRVSLKLVRSPTQRAAQRLLREARALARIDHPNIVRILAADVHRGAVYLVMELVEGQDLREWMQSPRPWSEVLSMLIGAGRGLAAAHASGILHRDFRPENVLVGWDGQAQVLDFGIARMSPDHPEHETLIEEEADEDDERGVGEGVCGSAPMVGSFANMPVPDKPDEGTRSLRDAVAYMAPEQHERERADERSDQFGFCATLFEAVYGAHPFPGKDLLELALRASEGRAEFPASRGAPRWLERVLRRGLSPLREDRFSTMEDLLDALERYPGRRRRGKRAAGFLALGLALAGLTAFVASRAPENPACPDFEHELSERGLGDATGSTLSSQLGSAALQEREAMSLLAGELVSELEAWSTRWLTQREASCRRQHESGEAGARKAEARERCLAEQADEVAALAHTLVEGDETRFALRMTRVELALALLPDPQDCAQAHPLEPDEPSPPTPDPQLLQLRWQAQLWPDADAVIAAQELLERARQLGDAHTTLAAQLALGRAQLHTGAPEPAFSTLRAAMRDAERLGEDLLRAELSVELGRALSLFPGRSADAGAHLDDSAALLERVHAPMWLRTLHTHTSVRAALDSGQLERARALLNAQLADERDTQLLTFPRAHAHLQLARLYCETGAPQECLREAELARELLEDTIGGAHVELAPALTWVGRAQTLLEREDEALASLDRALLLQANSVLQRTASAELRRSLRRALVYRAELALNLNDPARAADAYREALALTPETEFSARARLLFELAHGHEYAKRGEQALANYSEALRLALRASSRDESLIARVRFGHARALLLTGDASGARWELERCRDLWPAELAEDPDAARLATTLRQLDSSGSDISTDSP